MNSGFEGPSAAVTADQAACLAQLQILRKLERQRLGIRGQA
jgi:hypothetical protein